MRTIAAFCLWALAGCATRPTDPCIVPCAEAQPPGAEWPCAPGARCDWDICAEMRGERPQICTAE